MENDKSKTDSLIVGRRVISREGAIIWAEELEMSPQWYARMNRQAEMARRESLRRPPWWAWWVWLDQFFTPRGRRPTPWKGLDGLGSMAWYEPSDQPGQRDEPPKDAGAR